MLQFKNIFKQRLTYIVIISIIISYIMIYQINYKPLYDKFSNISTTSYNYINLMTNYLTSDNALYHGTVSKYYNDNKYNYLYKFNLPKASGGDFSNMNGDYTVLLGHSLDNLIPIGKLELSPDGWFYLEYISNEDYHYTRIVYTNYLNTSKNIIIFQKDL